MNVAHELLKAAQAAGVIVEAVGNNLKLRARAEPPAHLLAALRKHKPELLAALVERRPDSSECSDHWMISLPPQRMERWFSPAVTRAELELRYPGAILVALPPVTSRATAEEAAELRRLVDALATREGFTEDEKAEALENALRDPQGALRSFKAMMEER